MTCNFFYIICYNILDNYITQSLCEKFLEVFTAELLTNAHDM